MGTNSLILSNNEIENLKAVIKEKNLNNSPITNKYELLRIKDQDINLILYSSGKLVFNESNKTKNLIKSILQTETNYDYVLGSDETGKGEWYGPLVVVVTALKPEDVIKLRLMGVKDSKTIKTPKIIEVAKQILEAKIPYQSLVLNPSTYNRLYTDFKRESKNLNDVMAWAHSRVIEDLLKKIKFNQAQVVIDKFDFKKTEYRLRKLEDPKIKVIQKIRGETEVPVAAASIIAKYLFEKEVESLNERYKLDLKNIGPDEITPDILPYTAKMHFNNVKKYVKSD